MKLRGSRVFDPFFLPLSFLFFLPSAPTAMRVSCFSLSENRRLFYYTVQGVRTWLQYHRDIWRRLSFTSVNFLVFIPVGNHAGEKLVTFTELFHNFEHKIAIWFVLIQRFPVEIEFPSKQINLFHLVGFNLFTRFYFLAFVGKNIFLRLTSSRGSKSNEKLEHNFVLAICCLL